MTAQAEALAEAFVRVLGPLLGRLSASAHTHR